MELHPIRHSALNKQQKGIQMDDLTGNENRARQEKASVQNRMTPMPADGGVARASPPNDLPKDRGICSSNPMTLDPHSAGRHSTDNLPNRAPERPRTQRTAETKRRLESRNTDYKY
jgi:hypothetical protein